MEATQVSSIDEQIKKMKYNVYTMYIQWSITRP